MEINTKYYKKVIGGLDNNKYYDCNKDKVMNRRISDLKTNKIEKILNVRNEERILNTHKVEEKVFFILRNIYEKTKGCIFRNDTSEGIYITDLMNLLSSIPFLMVCYTNVMKSQESNLVLNKETLELDQTNFLDINDKEYDEKILELLEETSLLLKQGKYIWGINKKILVGKKCLTIPSFMDKIIQEAIRQILVAIYEPTFDKMNVCFGFRPNRSVQDAIYSLTNRKAEGLDKALKGCVEFSFDKLNNIKLIKILEKKIKDRKFISLIKDRINYECSIIENGLYIKEKDKTLKDKKDLSYLSNIYFLELDNFVMENINKMIQDINVKTRGINSDGKMIKNNERINYVSNELTIRKILRWIRFMKGSGKTFKENLIKLQTTKVRYWKNYNLIFKGNLKNVKSILKECDVENKTENEIIKNLQKMQRIIRHRILNLPYLDVNKKKLRVLYTRYSDDWIILTNAKMETLENIKKMVGIFLKEELHTILVEDKTLLINLKKSFASFMGFEISYCKERKIEKYNSDKINGIKINEGKVFARIDEQRQIYNCGSIGSIANSL